VGVFASGIARTTPRTKRNVSSSKQSQSWRTLSTISNGLDLNTSNRREHFPLLALVPAAAAVRTYSNTPIHHHARRGRGNSGRNGMSRHDLEKEKQLTGEANELHELPLGSLSWEDIQHAKRLIHRLTHTNNYTSVKNAERLLERLVAEGNGSESGSGNGIGGSDGQEGGQNPAAYVEDKLYNTIIGAYGKCNHYDSASRAHDVLDRMTDRYETSTSAMYNNNDDDGDESSSSSSVLLKSPSPNIVTYNSLMNAWCNSGSEEAVERVEHLMEILESEDDGTMHSRGVLALQPDNISYNTLMNTYANQVNEYGYAQKAEDVLLRMSELQKDGKADISPCTTSFNTVLKAWKNTATVSGGGMESAKRAEGILKLMIKLHAEGHTGIKPDPISFTSLVHAYAKPHGEDRTITPEVADCLEGIADILISEGENGDSDGDSDSDSGGAVSLSVSASVGKTHGIAATTFGSIIEFIGKGDLEDAGIRAKRLLDKMKDAKVAGKIVDSPNTKIYSQVLRCLIQNDNSDSDSNSKDTAAMDMIQDMMEGNAAVEPNAYMMNGVLHHFSRSGDVEGAESFFKTMTKVAEEKGYFTRPDVASYNIMANMYFRSKNKDTARKVYQLFQHMEESYDAGLLFETELFFYSIVINMLQKSSELHLRQKAYDVLLAAIKRSDDGQLRGQADSIMFNLVLSSLAKQYNNVSAKKAVELLQLMEDRYAEGFTSAPPDTLSYNHVLVAITRSMSMGSELLLTIFQKLLDLDAEGNDYIEADKAAYETVLYGLSNPRHGDRKKALEIVEKMIKHEKVNLTSKCLDLLLVAHCSEQDRRKGEMAAFDATRCFLQLVQRFEKGEIDVLPSREGINAIIICWADTKHWNKVKHSIELYNLMQSLSSKGVEYISPDAQTISLIFKAFSKHNHNNALKKAKKFRESVDEKLLDTVAYNTYLHVVGKSRDGNKANTARQILDEMEEKGLTDTISYNIFLNACAFTGGSDENKSKALQLALKTYKEIPSPDELTFVALLKACNNLGQSGDNKQSQQVFKSIFTDACEKGLLSKKVINELMQIPLPQREEGLGNSLAVNDLKAEWRRNVQKPKR